MSSAWAGIAAAWSRRPGWLPGAEPHQIHCLIRLLRVGRKQNGEELRGGRQRHGRAALLRRLRLYGSERLPGRAQRFLSAPRVLRQVT